MGEIAFSREQDQTSTRDDTGTVQPSDGGESLVQGIKLHLGCGPKIVKGFVNVDLPNNWSKVKPDVEADISKPLPFPDNYADGIYAFHVIEHFWRWEVEDILKDWVRVLKPGGVMILELPCLDKIIAILKFYLESGKPINDRLTVWGLYGDPNYKSIEMSHKWAWSASELIDLLESLGMTAEQKEPKTHIPVRDMRIEAWLSTPIQT